MTVFQVGPVDLTYRIGQLSLWCCMAIMLMGHSVSNQQGILGHLTDFDKTWCAYSTYGAYCLHQFLA